MTHHPDWSRVGPQLLEALEGLMVGCEWREAHLFMDATPLAAGWATKRMPTDEALTTARSAIAAAKGQPT